jgi:transmembrane sensor
MEYPDQLIVNYLAGECPEMEANRLHRWRQEKAENELYFQKLNLLWHEGAINTDTFNPDVSKALVTLHRKMESGASHELPRYTPSRNLWYYPKRIAASVIILFCAGIGYYLYENSMTDFITVEAPAAEKKDILLPDGTRVWLRENSILRSPGKFATDSREVYLEGEAYFEVTKDSARPFIIHAYQSVTQVLGTSFNIRSFLNDEKTTVTVTSGQVSFYKEDHPDLKIFLVMGDRGVLSPESNVAIKETNTDANFLSWKTNKIIFDNTPLASVAEALSAHYHKKIVISTSLSNCRFTSTFENQTLEEILEELVLLQQIKIENVGDVIQLTGNGC